jgi:hypothetical protein
MRPSMALETSVAAPDSSDEADEDGDGSCLSYTSDLENKIRAAYLDDLDL